MQKINDTQGTKLLRLFSLMMTTTSNQLQKTREQRESSSKQHIHKNAKILQNEIAINSDFQICVCCILSQPISTSAPQQHTHTHSSSHSPTMTITSHEDFFKSFFVFKKKISFKRPTTHRSKERKDRLLFFLQRERERERVCFLFVYQSQVCV